jgi:putative flippase GtrA
VRQSGGRPHVGKGLAVIACGPVVTMNAKPIPKVVRFVIVGAVNTLFGYLVFAGLTRLGISDVLAVPAAMAIGAIFNFLSYGKMVFASLDPRRLPRFVAAYLCLYACNVLGLRALERLSLEAYGAQALLVFPLAALAYFLNDRWVFRGN